MMDDLIRAKARDIIRTIASYDEEKCIDPICYIEIYEEVVEGLTITAKKLEQMYKNK